MIDAAIIGASGLPPRRGPTQKYELLGNTIVLSQGDSSFEHTGWRTWAGSWLLAKHFECKPVSGRKRVLDLSCGTGLAGIALARAGYEVTLCDMEVNMGTVRSNVARNATGAEEEHDATGLAQAVGYSWGTPLPLELRIAFDIVLCGDLLYHVWSGRLHNEFLTTLQYLNGGAGAGAAGGAEGGRRPDFLFGWQVRSGRQEGQVLESAARRLGLVQEELPIELSGEDSLALLHPQAKYRMVRLRRAPAEVAMCAALPPAGTGEAEEGEQ